MFRIWRSVDVSFAHHVRGHSGACVNVHGHTWKLEVCAQSNDLDREGFVVDFKRITTDVLQPTHALLDHALAIGEDTWKDVAAELESLGQKLVASREAIHGAEAAAALSTAPVVTRLGGAENRYPGGMKVAVFPFSPTSERLAEWLYGVAVDRLKVSIAWTRVYETLHPVESVAEYSR